MTKTLFIPCRSKADICLVVGNILDKVSAKRICLVTTAQFVGDLFEIKKKLEEHGKKAIIAPGRPNPGQILGCDAQAALNCGDADAFVYLGTGHFHPLKVALATGKPTYMVHPNGGIEKVPGDLMLRHQKIRAARVHQFKEAVSVGILVSTKPGQNRMKQALALKKKLLGRKETFIFAANEIKPDYLIGYNVDAWVNTACPRIAEDAFDKPMVDISEINKL